MGIHKRKYVTAAKAAGYNLMGPTRIGIEEHNDYLF